VHSKFTKVTAKEMEHKNNLVVILVLLFQPCFGQNEEVKIVAPKRFISRIEASVGLNLSNPSSGTFPSYKVIPEFGYLISLNVSHDFSFITSLDFSVFYERRSSKTSDDILNQSLTPPQIQNTINESSLTYLTIAAAPNFRLSKTSRFFLGAGGYCGFLQGVEVSYTSSIGGVVQYYGRSTSTIYNKDYDAGLVFSLKYRYPMNERRDIHVQLLNCLGLVDVTSDKLKSLPIKNNTYAILIGLTLKK
jgi:hypothetical protein